MVYLADKYGKFLPKDIRKRTGCINWVMWQMAGQGPMTGACYGHFYAYAPPEVNRDYAVARYGMEVSGFVFCSRPALSRQKVFMW